MEWDGHSGWYSPLTGLRRVSPVHTASPGDCCMPGPTPGALVTQGAPHRKARLSSLRGNPWFRDTGTSVLLRTPPPLGSWDSAHSFAVSSRLHGLRAAAAQISCHSVVSNSLRPHGLQHARPPCPSATPRTHSNSCPSSRWCHPTISSSVIPFSSCLQSFPALGSFPMSRLFVSVGQSIGASASASVLLCGSDNIGLSSGLRTHKFWQS